MMPRSRDALLGRIVHFVRTVTGTRKPLSEETNIAGELGIDGDDALDLMLAFQRQFEVDMAGFEFDRYFGSEGDAITGGIMRMLRRHHSPEPLTIGMLVDAATHKRWPRRGSAA